MKNLSISISEITERLSNKYKGDFFSSKDLKVKLSDIYPYFNEDCGNHILGSFWDNVLGYILNEDECNLYIFVQSKNCNYNDNNFSSSFVNLFSYLDGEAAWSVFLIEVDDLCNETQVDIVSWYMAEIIDSTNLSKDKKEESKKQLRDKYSKKFN